MWRCVRAGRDPRHLDTDTFRLLAEQDDLPRLRNTRDVNERRK